jgi:hypothetical protein
MGMIYCDPFSRISFHVSFKRKARQWKRVKIHFLISVNVIISLTPYALAEFDLTTPILQCLLAKMMQGYQGNC